MKRFSKFKSKKGFTLLETLLATAILVIVGSMLMEGFITAMGFSYNSSVYSRSAAYNSQLCITQLSKWSMYGDGISSYDPSAGDYVKLDAAYANVGEYAWNQTNHYVNPKYISFEGSVSGGNMGKIRVAVYEETSVKTGAADLSTFTDESINSGTNAYADNRTILFYYPKQNGNFGDSYFGNTHVYVKADGSYVWGYEDSSDPSAIDGVVVIGNRD
ncbi:MAG: type II secretion system protein [Clostridiales bacterium]|nr:type II secretion system protein [Clostridiales bacterium]